MLKHFQKDELFNPSSCLYTRVRLPSSEEGRWYKQSTVHRARGAQRRSFMSFLQQTFVEPLLYATVLGSVSGWSLLCT